MHFYCLTPKLNGHLQLSSSNETKNNLSYQIFYQVYLWKQCMCFEFKCAYCTADYVSFQGLFGQTAFLILSSSYYVIDCG